MLACAKAPVAQWTECRPPEPKSAVRVCAGAPCFDLDYNSCVPHKHFAVLLLSLLCMGCGTQASGDGTTTPTMTITLSTIPLTTIPIPSETPLPLRATPTVDPVEGVSSTPINVRAEPSTASDVLGIIPANTMVQIIGKDPGGNWYQIIFPQGTEEKGWVAAQYVTTADQSQVQTIGDGEGNPGEGNVAIVQQQLNVRSGPGTDFSSLGTLNPNDVVNLTGKDANGAWLQIEFAAGPESKGWINAAFAQAQGVENLPIVTEAGAIIGTGTPTNVPLSPTPTVLPAREDNDSAANPIVSVNFEPTGTRTFIHSGDVSAPQGDSQDWIAFTTYSTSIIASLECRGSSLLKVELTRNSISADINLACGDQMKVVPVTAGEIYLIHLQAVPSSDVLQYTNYTLTITASQ